MQTTKRKGYKMSCLPIKLSDNLITTEILTWSISRPEEWAYKIRMSWKNQYVFSICRDWNITLGIQNFRKIGSGFVRAGNYAIESFDNLIGKIESYVDRMKENFV